MDEDPAHIRKSCILIADDDHEHLLLFSKALKSAGIEHPLIGFNTGDQLIRFLNENKSKPDGQAPLLIISGINSQNKNSKDILKGVRAHPDFYAIPFIVLSARHNIHDIKEYYQLGASSFLPKPNDQDEMQVIANGIKLFWIDKHS
jgi:DNA-binding NtrC family response regulator